MPPERYEKVPAVLLLLSRRVHTAAGRPCLNGSFSEDERVQCYRALTISYALLRYSIVNEDMEAETIPLPSMTKYD